MVMVAPRWLEHSMKSDIEENCLKTAIGTIAVTLLLGLCTLTVHAANRSNAENMPSARVARAPSVTDAWARATVPGQPVGAVYMKIDSPSDAALIKIESDAAKTVGVHAMRVENGVMQMREHERLDIPAGKTVELAPGGMHLMLFGLRKQLKAAETIQLTMTFIHANKTKTTTLVDVPIRPFGQ